MTAKTATVWSLDASREDGDDAASAVFFEFVNSQRQTILKTI
jgi:hypothetical protein